MMDDSSSGVEDSQSGQLSFEADDESDSDLAAPNPKKRVLTALRGAATYRTRYSSEWEKVSSVPCK